MFQTTNQYWSDSTCSVYQMSGPKSIICCVFKDHMQANNAVQELMKSMTSTPMLIHVVSAHNYCIYPPVN